MDFVYDRREYAASSWTLEHMPLDQALSTFGQYGFKNVEIWADTVHLDPRGNPDIRQIKRQLAELNMRVHSVHAPFRNYKDRPLDERAFFQLRVDNVKKTIDYAQALSCGIVVLHALDRGEYNYPNAQVDRVQDYVGTLSRYAKQNGVQLAIEDVPPGKDADEIFTSLEHQKELFRGMDIRYCLDIGHVPLLGADMFKEIDAVGSDLITLHIHNNCGVSDDHNLPNEGILDWPKIHDYLRKSGYAGEFVLEIYGGTTVQRELDVVKKMNGLFSKP